MRHLLLSLPLGLALACQAAPPAARPAPPEPAAEDAGGAAPDAATLERLARSDPIAFMRACLRRYDREVKGYRCILHKQERIDGKLHRPEETDDSFREKPFSVLMRWVEGAGQAAAVLYVEGAHDNQLLVHPAGWRGRLVSVVVRDPEGADARAESRFPITDFGMKKGLERAIETWGAAQKAGTLKVEYRGKQKVAEAGDRDCYVLHRYGYQHPEDGGVTDATLYFDAETLLMVGSILKGAENRLIGEYWFRDVQLNPDFPPDTFTRAGLTK